MGTTTIYTRLNDMYCPLDKMSKKELRELNKRSPYSKDNWLNGWSVPYELHNGNVYLLVSWKGMLMKLEEAPEKLNKKYYNKYTGKTLNEYEWTVLKRFMQAEIIRLDKEFKKQARKKTKQ